MRHNSPSTLEFRNHGSGSRRDSVGCRTSGWAVTCDSASKKWSATWRIAPTKPLDFPSVMLYVAYSMTGVEIRALREKLGWTQMALAEAVGVTSNTVARWERGEMAMSEPAARLLQKIAAEQRSRTGKK
jgi:DNA-binding transcriptional regulator YiaG